MTKRRIFLFPLLILTALLLALSLFGCGAVPETPDTPVTPGTKEASEQQTEDSSQNVLSVGSFTTMDLDGNEVTESIFAEKEYTMVNVWGTFCTPCINEMPDLEKLHQSLPDNMQVIGVVCDLPYEEDAADILASANDIVNITGVTYPSLRIWNNADWFYATSNVVPTTYFFDSEGNLVGDIIYGADINAYKEAIERFGK